MHNVYRIVLDCGNTVYYQPGQTVTGKLKVQVYKQNCVKIDVSITGQANLFRDLFNNREQFFSDTVTVWRPAHTEDGSNTQLSPGTYIFPFQFALPLNIPSSFEGPLGKIEYNIQVLIKVSSGLHRQFFGDKCIVVVRDLLDPLPITFDGGVLIQSQHYRETVIRSTGCMCISGPVTVLLDLPKSAFHIGESIPFTANITNNGPTGVKMIVKLICKVRYGTRFVTNTITSVWPSDANYIRKGQATVWNGLLVIPTDISPTVLNCELISVDYYLELRIFLQRFLPFMSVNSKVLGLIPIVLGGIVDEPVTIISQQISSSYGIPPPSQTSVNDFVSSAPQRSENVQEPWATTAFGGVSTFVGVAAEVLPQPQADEQPPSYEEVMKQSKEND